MILDFRADSPRFYHMAGASYAWTNAFRAFGAAVPPTLRVRYRGLTVNVNRLMTQ